MDIKKSLGISFIAMLMIPIALTAGESINVLNAVVNESFNLSHSVSRQSYFKTIVKTAKVNEDALQPTNIGEFRIKNNTRDGFTLKISTAMGGVLAPTSMDDGEVDIPYGIVLSQTGQVGTGIDSKLTFSGSELATTLSSPLLILNKAGTHVTSATDVIFQIDVVIEDNTDSLGMAGTYEDVITLTYEDL